jgi:hypothetical protein
MKCRVEPELHEPKRFIPSTKRLDGKAASQLAEPRLHAMFFLKSAIALRVVQRRCEAR